MTLNQLVEYCKKNNIKVPSKVTKSVLIEILQKELGKQKEFEEIVSPKLVKPTLAKAEPMKKVVTPTLTKAEPMKKVVTLTLAKTESKIKAPTPTPQFKKQTQLPVVTTDSILEVLTDEWQTIKHLIFKLKIKDMMDARFLQLKLKELERKGKVQVDIKIGKKSWKIK